METRSYTNLSEKSQSNEYDRLVTFFKDRGYEFPEGNANFVLNAFEDDRLRRILGAYGIIANGR